MVELVTVNKMGVPNVAMIFGPTLMSNESVSTGLVLLGILNVGLLTFSQLLCFFLTLIEVSRRDSDIYFKILDWSNGRCIN